MSKSKGPRRGSLLLWCKKLNENSDLYFCYRILFEFFIESVIINNKLIVVYNSKHLSKKWLIITVKEKLNTEDN